MRMIVRRILSREPSSQFGLQNFIGEDRRVDRMRRSSRINSDKRLGGAALKDCNNHPPLL
jgi:hypothetical protein